MTNVAFVGTAHIHTPAFINTLLRRTDVKATVVYDADPRRAKHAAEKLGAKIAETPEAVYSDDTIKGVIICSQTNLHEPLVLSAARAKKHMFVEKPLGMAGRDAYSMATAIQDSGLLFQTGYFQRSDPKNQFIKDQITKGNLGKITRVRGSNGHSGALGDWFRAKPDAPHEEWRWMADVQQSGVGGFGDLGTHALDILIWWLGDVAKATAQVDVVTGTYGGTDETGEGLMRFKNGAIGSLAAGWVDQADPVKYLISGTDGHLAVINNDLHYLSRREAKFDGSTAVRKNEMPAAAPHAFELFLDALVNKALPIALVGAREAAYRSAVMEAMYEGAKTGTWITPRATI
ncbi:MAG TPA: Gfo/Idh/MocA family oxidoreductase [Tepidisphaeraceae bacterium]|jgi:predicted dehydrogenase